LVYFSRFRSRPRHRCRKSSFCLFGLCLPASLRCRKHPLLTSYISLHYVNDPSFCPSFFWKRAAKVQPFFILANFFLIFFDLSIQ
jgi:hypothetical protein